MRKRAEKAAKAVAAAEKACRGPYSNATEREAAKADARHRVLRPASAQPLAAATPALATNRNVTSSPAKMSSDAWDLDHELTHSPVPRMWEDELQP